MATPCVLAIYNPLAPTVVSADDSSHGLGAVLLQQTTQGWRTAAYASRSMTDTETQYARIDKEALPLIWALEKLSIHPRHDSPVGDWPQITCTFTEPHPTWQPTTASTTLPPQADAIQQRHLSTCQRSYFMLHWCSACSALLMSYQGIFTQQEAVESHITAVAMQLPAIEEQLKVYRSTQIQDALCSRVIEFTNTGWLTKQQIQPELQPFWEAYELLTGHAGKVPVSLYTLWWPEISNNVEKLVRHCPQCSKSLVQAREPLIPTLLPPPYWEVGADLIKFWGSTYLVVADFLEGRCDMYWHIMILRGSLLRSYDESRSYWSRSQQNHWLKDTKHFNP